MQYPRNGVNGVMVRTSQGGEFQPIFYGRFAGAYGNYGSPAGSSPQSSDHQCNQTASSIMPSSQQGQYCNEYGSPSGDVMMGPARHGAGLFSPGCGGPSMNQVRYNIGPMKEVDDGNGGRSHGGPQMETTTGFSYWNSLPNFPDQKQSDEDTSKLFRGMEELQAQVRDFGEGVRKLSEELKASEARLGEGVRKLSEELNASEARLSKQVEEAASETYISTDKKFETQESSLKEVIGKLDEVLARTHPEDDGIESEQPELRPQRQEAQSASDEPRSVVRGQVEAEEKSTDIPRQEGMGDKQPEKIWLGGWGTHLRGSSLERAINNVVGGKATVLQLCGKGGSAIVELPKGVSKQSVFDKNGSTDYPGFKVGRRPGVQVREVGIKEPPFQGPGVKHQNRADGKAKGRGNYQDGSKEERSGRTHLQGATHNYYDCLSSEQLGEPQVQERDGPAGEQVGPQQQRGARNDPAAAQREPERFWIGGFRSHLGDQVVVKLVSKAIGSPCRLVQRLLKLGSAIVELPPNAGVSLAEVLKLNGRKDIPGFDNGSDPGLRVRKVGDRAGRGNEADKTKPPQRSTVGHRIQPGVESQTNPGGTKDEGRSVEESQQQGRDPRPIAHRPQAEAAGNPGLGGNTNSKMAKGHPVTTPARAADKIFKEDPNLTEEEFYQSLEAKLLDQEEFFSRNQKWNASKYYYKLQTLLLRQAETFSRPDRSSPPACPPHGVKPQSQSKGSPEVAHREAQLHEAREENKGVEESGEELIQKLDAFRPDEPEQKPAAATNSATGPSIPIGSAGGDGNLGKSPGSGPAQPALKSPDTEQRDATEQEIRENYEWDPVGRKWVLGAKQLEKVLEKDGLKPESVPGTGPCFYLAVLRKGTDHKQIKNRAKVFYEGKCEEIVQALVDRRIITGDDVKTFDALYRAHIDKESSQAGLPEMNICAMSERIDISVVGVEDGKQLAYISGQREWEQDNTSTRPVIMVGLRREGKMVYNSDFEPIEDSEGNIIRSEGHCWRVKKIEGNGDQGLERNGGGEGNGQEWTGLGKDQVRRPL